MECDVCTLSMIWYDLLPFKDPPCLARRALPSHRRCSPWVVAWAGRSARSGEKRENGWILKGWGNGAASYGIRAYIYVYTYIYIYVHIYIYTYVCTFTYVLIYLYTYILIWFSISSIQKDCPSRNLENWNHQPWLIPSSWIQCSQP